MAVFDILKSKARCPYCGHAQAWTLLYRYGDCLEREKSVGDKITWSEKELRFYDHGDNVGGQVQIHGEVDNRCGACGKSLVYGIITIKENVIKGVELFKKPADLGKKGFRQVS